ncbi:MAG TPA: sulfite exporter TauE/SafE family protein [Ureibacillus sp.]|nr:sulfite exporter TauE/SafE family protein [Ureibacillus sp.]
MELSILLVIILLGLGFIGSFFSGLLGIGGAIIKYPMLLYIPPLFGITAFSAHQVSGMIAVEVFFSSLIGVWAYRKGGYLNKPLILYMGSAIILGSFIGSYGSSMLDEGGVNFVYGVLAILAAVLMFIPKKNVPINHGDLRINRPLAASLAFIVGIGSGIVGAGGGFLLVPIMLTILNVPTRITIATSLAITFISSIGGSVGKIITGQLEYGPALILIIISFIATPLGVKAGKAMNTKVLRWLLATLITATALKIWLEIFFNY